MPSSSRAATLQDDVSASAVLLSRARTLEQRGRLDLAKQDWLQVLTVDPNQAQALAGLVRALRAEGHGAEAAPYLSRLRASHPKDPELSRLDEASKNIDVAKELSEAERLSHSGDNRAAWAIYRRVYGLTPPSGAPALAYYQAEAATEDGRPQAIAGLRALYDRYPQDARYALALGRILLTSPRTQAEGRTLLEKYPGDMQARTALQSLNPAAPATATGAVRLPAKPSPATPLIPVAPGAELGVSRSDQSSLRSLPTFSQPAAQKSKVATSVTSGERNTRVDRHALVAQEQAGYTALNQHRTADAEQIFAELLTANASEYRALAGLGYVRVLEGDWKQAVRYFERAQESGDHSLALTRALVNAQFSLLLQSAAAATLQGDLPSAEVQYRAALREKPSDPEALEGLGSLLLRTGHAGEAASVFSRLVQVRPMSPTAWRGLVISQASAGRPAEALGADARIPPEARAPLQKDPSYLQALRTAESGTNVQIARSEAPSAPKTAPISPATVATFSAPAAPTQTPPKPVPASSNGQSNAGPQAAARSNGAIPPSSSQKPSGAGQGIITARATHAPEPATTVPTQSEAGTPVQTAQAASSGVPSAAEAADISKQPGQSPPTRNTSSAKEATNRTRRAAKSAQQAKTGSFVAAQPAKSASPTPIVAAAPPAQLSPARAIARERVTQALEAFSRGEYVRSADLYREAVRQDPDLPEASKGLIQALHASGSDAEALTALRQSPSGLRPVLDRDATFQVTVGEVFLATERPDEALHAYARAQGIFASQHLPPPLDVVVRIARLLSYRDDDNNLYREICYLGDRHDLSDAQRREVQMIWTHWAIHRARVLAAAGDRQRAVTVLNAAAEGFGGNPDVLSAVAEGYAGVGLPREAVALYKQQDLTKAPSDKLETAIRAAIAARDRKAAEAWARSGRERFPADAGMLTTIAELEQARGHEQKAIELSRQAKELAPNQDPGQVLTAELREASAGHGWKPEQSGKLAVLLVPGNVAGPVSTQGARPYLPSTPNHEREQMDTSKVPLLSGLDEPTR